MVLLILVDKAGSSYLLITKMTDFQKKNLIVLAPIVVASHSVIVAFILPMVEWSAWD